VRIELQRPLVHFRHCAEALVGEYKLKLIVIDYLQLMRGSNSRGNTNRTQEIAEITVGLKALAKELNVPIMLLSQLNRNVEGREDNRPHLADLRDSGAIEQNANVVLLVYREEYYLERKKPSMEDPRYTDWQIKMNIVKGKAKIIIAKNRHGEAGPIELLFDGRTTTFSDKEVV
jgi:replicative DNA helicase